MEKLDLLCQCESVIIILQSMILISENIVILSIYTMITSEIYTMMISSNDG